MKIIKVEGNKQIIRLNCVIKFCKSDLWGRFIFDSRTGRILTTGDTEEVICEDNLTLDIPFKKANNEQKIDYNKKYKNSYIPSKEPLIYDITNNKLIEMLNGIYGFSISRIEVEDEIKFISHKPIKQPKVIKVFSYENSNIITRKIKIKKYESKSSNPE